ncbi:MAG: hypothetical protein ABJC09_12610 [Terriglobia bacterium]
MNPANTVIAFTGDWIDIKLLRSAARPHGWDATTATTLTALRSIKTDRIAAILFDRQAVRDNWPNAASLLRTVHPGVPLIACLRFSEAGEWSGLRQAGVFHAVHSPLSHSEICQSLGFVWAGERQRIHLPAPLAIPVGMARLRLGHAAA